MIERRKFAELGGADHEAGSRRSIIFFVRELLRSPREWAGGNLARLERRRDCREVRLLRIRTPTWRSLPTVREGAITHKDSMGNEGRTEAGDVQVMSAWVRACAMPSSNLEDTATRIFQIWIELN